MNDQAADLRRECEVFCRYLSGAAPSAYVVAQYQQAHATARAFGPRDAGDAALVAMARAAPWLTRLADAYARHLAPRGALRAKLVLTLAILEVTPPYSHTVATGSAASTPQALARLVLHGAVGVTCVVLGVVLIGPVHLLTRIGGR